MGLTKFNLVLRLSKLVGICITNYQLITNCSLSKNRIFKRGDVNLPMNYPLMDINVVNIEPNLRSSCENIVI